MIAHRYLHGVLSMALLVSCFVCSLCAEEEISLCEVAASELHYFLGELQVASLLVSHATVQTDTARELVLEALPWSYGLGTSLWIVDEQGRWVARREKQGLTGSASEDVEPRRWADIWSSREPVFHPDWERRRLLMYYPVMSAEGERKGALVLSLPFPKFDTATSGLTVYSHDLNLLYGVNGRVHSERQKGRSSLTALIDDIRNQPEGALQFTIMDEQGALRALNVRWCHFSFLDTALIPLLESFDESEPELDGLSGRWVGAYTEKDLRDTAEEPALPKSGQLSAAILQDGDYIEVMAAGPGWRMRPRGVFSETRLSAAHVEAEGARRKVWMWDAVHDPATDTIKGTIVGDTVSEIVERTFYLKRLEGAEVRSVE